MEKKDMEDKLIINVNKEKIKEFAKEVWDLVTVYNAIEEEMQTYIGLKKIANNWTYEGFDEEFLSIYREFYNQKEDEDEIS